MNKQSRPRTRAIPCTYCRSQRHHCFWPTSAGTTGQQLECIRCSQLGFQCSGPVKKRHERENQRTSQPRKAVALSIVSRTLATQQLSYALTYDLVECYRRYMKINVPRSYPAPENAMSKVFYFKGKLSELNEVDELRVLIYMMRGASLSTHSSVIGRIPSSQQDHHLKTFDPSTTYLSSTTIGLSRAGVGRALRELAIPKLSAILNRGPCSPKEDEETMILAHHVLEYQSGETLEEGHELVKAVVAFGLQVLESPDREIGQAERWIMAMVNEEVFHCIVTGDRTTTSLRRFDNLFPFAPLEIIRELSPTEIQQLSLDLPDATQTLRQLFQSSFSLKQTLVRLILFDKRHPLGRLPLCLEHLETQLTRCESQVELICGMFDGEALFPVRIKNLVATLKSVHQMGIVFVAGVLRESTLYGLETVAARSLLYRHLTLLTRFIKLMPQMNLSASAALDIIKRSVVTLHALPLRELEQWMRVSPERKEVILNTLRYASFFLVEASVMLQTLEKLSHSFLSTDELTTGTSSDVASECSPCECHSHAVALNNYKAVPVLVREELTDIDQWTRRLLLAFCLRGENLVRACFTIIGTFIFQRNSTWVGISEGFPSFRFLSIAFSVPCLLPPKISDMNKEHKLPEFRSVPCSFCRSRRERCFWPSSLLPEQPLECIRCSQLRRKCSGPVKKRLEREREMTAQSQMAGGRMIQSIHPTVGAYSVSHKLGQQQMSYSLTFDLIEHFKRFLLSNAPRTYPTSETILSEVFRSGGKVSELVELDELQVLTYMMGGALWSMHSSVVGNTSSSSNWLPSSNLGVFHPSNTSPTRISIGYKRASVCRALRELALAKLWDILSRPSDLPSFNLRKIILAYHVGRYQCGQGREEELDLWSTLIYHGLRMMETDPDPDSIRPWVKMFVIEGAFEGTDSGSVGAISPAVFDNFFPITPGISLRPLSSTDLLTLKIGGKPANEVCGATLRSSYSYKEGMLRLFSFDSEPGITKYQIALARMEHHLSYCEFHVTLCLTPYSAEAVLPLGIGTILAVFRNLVALGTRFAWTATRKLLDVEGFDNHWQELLESARNKLHRYLGLLMKLVGLVEKITRLSSTVYEHVDNSLHNISCVSVEEIALWLRLFPEHDDLFFRMLRLCGFMQVKMCVLHDRLSTLMSLERPHPASSFVVERALEDVGGVEENKLRAHFLVTQTLGDVLRVN